MPVVTTSASTSALTSSSHGAIIAGTTAPPDGAPDPTRVVRFDSKCVLIPERCRKRSRVVTKSVSLPLWKRRSPHHTQFSDTESADDPASPVTPTAPEDKHIVIKVPLPSFIVRSSRSPSRARSPSASPRIQPLSPCLVHRSPSSSPASAKMPALRRTSLPIYTQKKDNSITTVPLRACCPNCVPITEECLREGEQWEVRFTRGARRRRSASLDHTSTRPGSLAGPDSTGDGGTSLALLAITVDEVDRRRRSLELAEEDIRHRDSPSPPSPNHPDESLPLSRPASSSQESSDSGSTLAPNCITGLLARTSPIQEEDEDQLFPLPSPRRTPNASPSPSLDPSPRPSPVPSRSSSRRSTPAPSPNASMSCINTVPTKPSTRPRPDNMILTTPLTRKYPKLTEASESLSIPKIPHRVTSLPDRYGPSLPVRSNSAPAPTSPTASSFSSSFSSPKSSPSIPMAASSKKHKKPSFSLPFLKAGADALKVASVDVLKGVGTMSGTSGMGGGLRTLGC